MYMQLISANPKCYSKNPVLLSHTLFKTEQKSGIAHLNYNTLEQLASNYNAMAVYAFTNRTIATQQTHLNTAAKELLIRQEIARYPAIHTIKQGIHAVLEVFSSYIVRRDEHQYIPEYAAFLEALPQLEHPTDRYLVQAFPRFMSYLDNYSPEIMRIQPKEGLTLQNNSSGRLIFKTYRWPFQYHLGNSEQLDFKNPKSLELVSFQLDSLLRKRKLPPPTVEDKLKRFALGRKAFPLPTPEHQEPLLKRPLFSTAISPLITIFPFHD
jgi:hypothetical protein